MQAALPSTLITPRGLSSAPLAQSCTLTSLPVYATALSGFAVCSKPTPCPARTRTTLSVRVSRRPGKPLPAYAEMVSVELASAHSKVMVELAVKSDETPSSSYRVKDPSAPS